MDCPGRAYRLPGAGSSWDPSTPSPMKSARGGRCSQFAKPRAPVHSPQFEMVRFRPSHALHTEHSSDRRLHWGELQQNHLTFSPPADPVTLIRRVPSPDLTGLPPTPEEVDAFVQESIRHPALAIQQLTERLPLSSGVWRALGSTLARCRRRSRQRWLHGQGTRAQLRLQVPRRRHASAEQRQALRPVHPRAARGR